MMLGRAYHVLVAAVGAALLVWAVSWFVQPSIQPNNPSASLFEYGDEGEDTALVEQSDFVLRPLFIRGRQAPDEIVVDDAPIVSSTQQELSGITLIGVFASAESAGVVIERESGEKSRIAKGESLDGWQLLEVEPRSAVFLSNGGAEDRVEMGVVSSVTGSVTASSSAERDAADDEEASKGDAPPEKLTFESMYKKQAAEAKKRNSDTKSE